MPCLFLSSCSNGSEAVRLLGVLTGIDGGAPDRLCVESDITNSKKGFTDALKTPPKEESFET